MTSSTTADTNLRTAIEMATLFFTGFPLALASLIVWGLVNQNPADTGLVTLAIVLMGASAFIAGLGCKMRARRLFRSPAPAAAMQVIGALALLCATVLNLDGIAEASLQILDKL